MTFNHETGRTAGRAVHPGAGGKNPALRQLSVQKLREAVAALGHDWRSLMEDEPDPALGNGGPGRLAACFLDSLAALGCPAFGYGIHYEHGLFRQRFVDGRQVEQAEDWLRKRHGYEFGRSEPAFRIGFGGRISEHGARAAWTPEEAVIARA